MNTKPSRASGIVVNEGLSGACPDKAKLFCWAIGSPMFSGTMERLYTFDHSMEANTLITFEWCKADGRSITRIRFYRSQQLHVLRTEAESLQSCVDERVFQEC